MQNDLRRWIKLVESDQPPSGDEDWHEAIADQDWAEALYNSKTPEQVIYVLRLSGAQQRKIGDNPEAMPVWILGDKILEWDGQESYPTAETISQWLYDVDINNYFVGYEDRFNKEFWQHPQPLYHETTPKNASHIAKTGLGAANLTRGISNRGVGAAIFTTIDPDTAAGHYGGVVFEIDTQNMAIDGLKPYVSLEPPIVEKEYREILARQLGFDFGYDVENGVQEETVIIYGNVPPQYLRQQD